MDLTKNKGSSEPFLLGNQTVPLKPSNTVFEVSKNLKNICGQTYSDRRFTVSKMGQVYFDLYELGYNKVKQIEGFINNGKYNPYYDIDPEEMENLVIDTFGIHRDTAIMIISGAATYKYSTMLAKETSHDY